MIVGAAGDGDRISIIPRALSENQNSRPDWNSSEAKIATRTVGTAAITGEQGDEAGVQLAARQPALLGPAMARRRDSRTISPIAGIRMAISSSAISGGDSKDPARRSGGSR